MGSGHLCLLHTQPQGRLCLLPSPEPHLGSARVVQGELTHSPRWGAAPAQSPASLQLSILTSPIPASPSSFPSEPLTLPPCNTSLFPATDTQLGAHVCIKSSLLPFLARFTQLCHRFRRQKDVPSLPRELARERWDPWSRGRLFPSSMAWSTAPVVAQSGSSQRCCTALSW